MMPLWKVQEYPRYVFIVLT